MILRTFKIQFYIQMMLLLAHATLSKAQTLYVGVESGVNSNQLYTNASNRFFTDYKSLTGVNVAGTATLNINNWLDLQLSPTFIQKNYELTRSGHYNGQFQEFHNSYWQLPAIAQFSFGSRIVQGFLSVGAYSAYWSSAATKGKQPVIWNSGENTPESRYTIFNYNGGQTYDEKYVFDGVKDNRWEFGWVAGVGIRWIPNAWSRVYIEYRRYSAQTDQQKDYMLNKVPRYNQTTGISLGYQYRLARLTGLLRKNHQPNR